MVASSVFKKSTRSMFTVSVLILNELTVSGYNSTAGHEIKERLKGGPVSWMLIFKKDVKIIVCL